MKSFLPNDIKDQNRKVVFDILLYNPQLAKVEISEKTTMSFVTVSKVVEYFEQIGLVSVSGESREGSGGLGRKRVLYNLNPNRYTTIGIQMIGRRVAAVLLNLYGEAVDTYICKADAAFYEEQMKVVIEEIVNYFQVKAKAMNSQIIGIGIGVDGAINEGKRSLRMRISGNEERDYSYQEMLAYIEVQTGLPVVLENDVNASAIAEFAQFEKEPDSPNDLLFVALGEGIGAGIILDKKLHRGHNAGVGEMEYMCFDRAYKSKPSSVGWLENKIGLGYLREKYNDDFSNVKDMDEQKKKECVEYIGQYLALAISNIVSLLDMGDVVLAGETINAFSEDIVGIIEKNIRNYLGWDIQIVVSTKECSTAIGAAMLSLEKEMEKIIAG